MGSDTSPHISVQFCHFCSGNGTYCSSTSASVVKIRLGPWLSSFRVTDPRLSTLPHFRTNRGPKVLVKTLSTFSERVRCQTVFVIFYACASTVKVMV